MALEKTMKFIGSLCRKLSVMFLIVHCFVLVTSVVLIAFVEFGYGNPVDLDYAEADYLGDDYSMAANLDDNFSTANHANQTLTVEQAQHMIKEAVDEARHQFLRDPELKSFIGVQNKDFFDASRRCLAEDYHYYDYKIQDCRSCLRTNCDKDEMCRTECHSILKVKQLNDSLEEEKIKNQQLERAIQTVEEFQEQNGEDNHGLRIVLIVFATLTVIIIVAVTVLGILLKILWNRLKTPRKVKAHKVEGDELGEVKQMLHNEGDGDSGNGSVRYLESLQNNSTNV